MSVKKQKIVEFLKTKKDQNTLSQRNFEVLKTIQPVIKLKVKKIRNKQDQKSQDKSLPATSILHSIERNSRASLFGSLDASSIGSVIRVKSKDSKWFLAKKREL